MNAALACFGDSIRLLLDEAKDAVRAVTDGRGTPDEAFLQGRSQALAEALHTLSNQLQTFAVALPGVRDELHSFLSSQGYGSDDRVTTAPSAAGRG